ncbi:MAG: polyprenyl synthetase family protein [Spirochaetaceae bacterium]|nr:polyprenyl synthetase family protein [Spirochaetaceae bacterium]
MIFDFSIELQEIESVLNKNLPNEKSNEWNSKVFGHLPECITENHTSSLLEPGQRLLSLGGKRWRPLLMLLCAQAAAKSDNIPQEAYNLVPLIEFVHTASLIHDDIEDSADTRRGAPAAHITYGLDMALNAGSWLYFAAPVCINTCGLSPQQQLLLHNIYNQELRRLHLGQAMDILWHKDNTAIPSVSEYTAMVRLKTGTLASMAAQIGTIAGGGTESMAVQMGPVASDIGIGFQVLDDVLNLSKGNPGKKRGDDIVEGKKSLPIIMHLNSNPNDFDTVMDCFNRASKEGIDSPAVEECIQLVSSSDSIKKSSELASVLIREACNSISLLYPNTYVKDKISYLFESMIQNGV